MVTSFYGQSMKLAGTISGYNYNPKNGLFQKGGDVALEGSLSNVEISIFEGDKLLLSKSTNSKGEFSFKLPLGKMYEISYAKNGYEKSIIGLDLSEAKSAGLELNFEFLELVLNSHVQAKNEKDIVPFGIIKFESEEMKLSFTKTIESGGLLKKTINYDPAISLIETSISKNAPFLLKGGSKIVNSKEGENVQGENPSGTFGQLDDTNLILTEEIGTELIKRINSGSYILTEDLLGGNSLEEKKAILEKAKEQLKQDWANASTSVDTLYLLEREALILSMESDLKKAEEIILLKESELSQKNKIVWLMVFLLLLSLGVIGFYYWMWRDKKMANAKLIRKDMKIKESLSYAQKIQEAVLPARSEIYQLLPDSFILYLPKDVVSGDFYWFREVNGKVMVASVDCTGHGVPGAFMSMIGNVLLNQIVIEEGVTSPKEILKRLDEGVRAALKQSNADPFGNQDGMDMSICVIDKKEMKMTYAGAMNPIYRVSKNQVEILDVSKMGVGGLKFGLTQFEEFEVKLFANESIYLLSDGYMDQFGGTSEKFNLPRFKSLLAKVHSQPMKEQMFQFEKTLEEWQGDHEQTDDILVIGIRLT